MMKKKDIIILAVSCAVFIPGLLFFVSSTRNTVTGDSLEQERKACLAAKDANYISPGCWGFELRDIIARKGLPAAFAYIDDRYANDPRFRSNCHDVMHILGAEAYTRFKTDSSIIDSPETSYCGYGFYHGFIETMLAENGPQEYADARAYCERVGEKDGEAASGPCFHGIGHATFDSLDVSLWGDREKMVDTALSRCDKALTTEFERSQCASGVFNSFANAMSAHTYRLSFTSFDPVSFCSSESHIYQEGCLGEAGIGYIREKQMNRVQALAFVESVPSAFRQYMYFIYFSDETKRAIKNFSSNEFHDSCMALPGVAREGCIQGVLQGLREESQVGKSHVYTFPFCKLFSSDTLRNFCFDNVINYALLVEKETPEFKTACLSYTGRTELQCK